MIYIHFLMDVSEHYPVCIEQTLVDYSMFSNLSRVTWDVSFTPL